MAALIFYGWFAFYFGRVEDPHSTKLRLIAASPVRVNALVIRDHPERFNKDPRSRPLPRWEYSFKVDGEVYKGPLKGSHKEGALVKITYCAENPDLHCQGSPSERSVSSQVASNLRFVAVTLVALGLALLCLAWAILGI
jgi:hypothetical protein